MKARRTLAGTGTNGTKMAAIIREATRFLVAAATALGVTLGTTGSDQSQIANLKRRMDVNERTDSVVHSDLGNFCTVDNDGVRDPRLFHAIAEQVQREIREYDIERGREMDRWRKQIEQLNPDLKMPAITIR